MLTPHRSSRRFLALARSAFAMLLLFAFAGGALAQDLVGLFLSWKRDPTTTMTINWVDIYEGSSNTVWYRPVDAKDWIQAKAERSTVGPTTMQLRRLELTGLKPDTLYEFGIGESPRDPSHFWQFRTMPSELSRPIKFVAGGDMMHTREMVDTMNRQMQELEPDFALLLGDLAYANGVVGTRWIDWLQSWKEFSVTKEKRLIPLVICIGNHEVKGGHDGKAPESAPFFYSLFSLPEGRSYYALDFAHYLSLIVLDSQHTQPVAGPQAEWLEHALAERAKQEFLFAGYHFPAYGTTKAPKEGLPVDSDRAVRIREHWVPHFERYGTTAVFEADHHNFKRTHRLRKHQRDDENGILYLGDGAWGVVPREVPTPEEGWWLAKAEPRNHLWCIELFPGGSWKIKAVDGKGEVFDEVEYDRPRTTPVP